MSKLVINLNFRGAKINRNIYGHFAEHLGRCIYNGIYVGEQSEIPNINGIRTDVVEALRHIQVPVLRWPGGCFAEHYHWKYGIGPKEERKPLTNNASGLLEDNSFGTHEFMDLCEQIGCEPYINFNLASGTVEEMTDWVDYLNSESTTAMGALRAKNGREKPWKVKYFCIGNECWSCGGNMEPEYYAGLYRQYQSFLTRCRNNIKPFKIAVGPSSVGYDWTHTVMQKAAGYMDGLALHYYVVPGGWDNMGDAADFTAEEYYDTLKRALRMEKLMNIHMATMERFDPEHKVKVIMDEWGTWYKPETGTDPHMVFQQNTMRDAVVAAICLNTFNRHADRIEMANLAQLVNVLQAVILTEGKKMVLTPTYHVFDLYKAHQDAVLIESYVETEPVGEKAIRVPNMDVTASVNEAEEVHVTLANLSMEQNYNIEGIVCGMHPNTVYAKIITGKAHDYNDFGNNRVEIHEMNEVRLTEEGFTLVIPACSVMEIILK